MKRGGKNRVCGIHGWYVLCWMSKRCIACIPPVCKQAWFERPLRWRVPQERGCPTLIRPDRPMDQRCEQDVCWDSPEPRFLRLSRGSGDRRLLRPCPCLSWLLRSSTHPVMLLLILLDQDTGFACLKAPRQLYCGCPMHLTSLARMG